MAADVRLHLVIWAQHGVSLKCLDALRFAFTETKVERWETNPEVILTNVRASMDPD